MSQPKVRIAREAVVRHDARLDILCCLDPDEPLAAEQVSARTGIARCGVGYHLKVLHAFGLVGTAQREGTGPTLFVPCLDRQPEWITDAVKGHGAGARCAR